MAFERLTYHIIFATKHRQLLILPNLEAQTHAIISTKCRDLGATVRIVNGIADHIHILVDIPFKCCGSEFVKELKRRSSNDLKTIIPGWQGWQEGYGVFSVSYSQIPTVYKYIENQLLHHTERTSLEEYKLFLKKHGLESDSKYIE